jgi:hypothetical protein
MNILTRPLPFEIVFTMAMVTILLTLSVILDLPVNLPAGDPASFVKIHYLYPLIGVAGWSGAAFLGQRRRLASTFLIALPCYAVMLIVHFNLKLWICHINPGQFDDLYRQIDQLFDPVVKFCDLAYAMMSTAIPDEYNFYTTGFIAMFYASFCVHALMTPDKFRTVFIAALLFQGLGALAYLIAPALGPFIYESSPNPLVREAQAHMLAIYQQNAAEGAPWIAENGSLNLLAGLGAMPSLHAGGSVLFLIFAWRYARVLLPAYVPIVVYILVGAVATRWHYLIDLPVGIALAGACVSIAEYVTRGERRHAAPAHRGGPWGAPQGAAEQTAGAG